MNMLNSLGGERLKVKCSECGETPDAKESLKKVWEVVNGREICITYFKCPKCKKFHIVQLDNSETLKCLDEVGELLKYVAKCSYERKTPKKKKYNKMKHTNKKLNNLRKELVDMYSGKCKVCLEGKCVDLVVEMQE